MESHAAGSVPFVIVPFNDHIIIVRLLHCAEFSRWLSEVTQSLDAVSAIQILAGGGGLGEGRPPGTV
jgi:hypothetical protein